MLKKLLLLLLVALEVSTACTQHEPIDYLEPAGTFELRVTGQTEQALWGPREDYASATVYRQGRPLAVRGVADTLYPRFDWWLRLPQGRVLLGYRNLADTLADPFAQHLYLLDTAGGRPRLQGLGHCPLSTLTQYARRPLGQRAPSYWLTPDSLGLLLAAPDSFGHAQGPPYRFVELARAATYLPLPAGPTRADGLPLALDGITWSPGPAHQRLTLHFEYDDGRAVPWQFDRRTGHRLRRAAPPANTPTHHRPRVKKGRAARPRTPAANH